MHVLVAGSTGLIGSALVAELNSAGHRVTRLVRRDAQAGDVLWDPGRGGLTSGDLDGVDAVVNLAGRSIGAKRFSSEEKQRLWDSRVGVTESLGAAIATSSHPPRLVNASAVGFYGDRGDDVLTESEPAGEGFLAELCVAWEAATTPASDAGVVTLRSGIVLSAHGGALGRLLAPFGPKWLSPYRWGIAGPVIGRRWWSWISLRDEVRAITHLLTSGITGPVNLVSPAEATHRQFIKAVGRALRRPTAVPIPRWVIKLVLGRELAETLVLQGQRAAPTRLLADGFEFLDSDLERAMGDALGS
jgi:uncharacterized protein (TIGR01777 family)